MKERILQFLTAEKISPAEFADKIGVQRSSMSHILSGRNYPSAAFLQKMLKVYPLVNSRWLMIGDGPMNLKTTENIESTDENSIVNVENQSNNNNGSQDFLFNTPEEPKTNAMPTDHLADLLTDNGLSDNGKADSKLGGQVMEKTLVDSAEKASSDRDPHFHAQLSDSKEIEQVLIFYTDKTFRLYKPF